MIYILTLRYKSGDYYKIGRTDNLQNRLNMYYFPNDDDMTIEYVTETDDDAKYEYQLKKMFSENMKPECFRVNKNNTAIVNMVKDRGLLNMLDDMKHTFKGYVVSKIHKVVKKTESGDRGAFLHLRGRKYPIEINGCVKQIDELIEGEGLVRTGVRTYERKRLTKTQRKA